MTDSRMLELHPWLFSATPVQNRLEDLSAVNEDVLCILDDDDLEGNPLWFRVDVPIEWGKPTRSRLESEEEWLERLASLRAMPREDILPIIVFVDVTGSMRVIDGHHRIYLAMERNQATIQALVRFEL